jgi:hypothetical protein
LLKLVRALTKLLNKQKRRKKGGGSEMLTCSLYDKLNKLRQEQIGLQRWLKFSVILLLYVLRISSSAS